ncbi:2-oxoacid:acceptor oxidoreductase family protein [Candidatus Omnitrophota bacterium]
MIEEIICAGFGGQGIMLMGKIVATAAVGDGKSVTVLPSYGAEVRGGTAHCMVKIAHTTIASPYIVQADTCFAMNQPALEKFKNRIKKKGLLIINSSLAKKIPRLKDIRVIAVPLTEIAVRLGNIKVANSVALGVYLARKKIVNLERIVHTMREIAPPKKRHLIEINRKALEAGLEFMKHHD